MDCVPMFHDIDPDHATHAYTSMREYYEKYDYG
jgi:hypothetical protein